MRPFLITLCLWVPLVASATSLHLATKLHCEVLAGTSTVWKNGKPQTNSSAAVLKYELRGLDRERGTAILVGQTGSTTVQLIQTNSTLTFVERISNGGVFVTTIFAEALSGLGTGKHVVVDSRHNPLIGDPVSSQRHGWCIVTD